MIHINQALCTLCEACVRICHTTCISVNDKNLNINYDLCSTCCQCAAICPNGALTWSKTPTRKINKDILPSAENLLELFKTRRSIRKFKDEPIEEEKLEYICQTAKLAPTNVFDIELAVITDPKLISELELVSIKFIQKVSSRLYSFQPAFRILSKLTPAVNEIDRIKTNNTLKRKSIFQGAKALIIITADPRIPHAELSCQYALYNMALIAQTMGIGSCISGSGKMILSRSKEIKQRLTIPKNKKILGILFLGNPQVQFIRTVEGRNAPIRWFKKSDKYLS